MINLGGTGLSGSGNLSFNGVTPTTIGDYRLLGGTLGSAGANSFILPSFSGGGDSYSLSTTADNGFLDLVVASAATFSGSATWISNGSFLWSNSTNWTDGAQQGVPGTSLSRTADTATFSGSGAVTSIDLTGVNPSLAALSFTNSNANYTLSNGSLTLKAGSGLATVTVSGTQSIGSLLTLSSSVDMVVQNSPDLLTLSGPIGGSGALLLGGSGTLVLSNSGNSYSGGTYVNSGTLLAEAAGAIPQGSSLTVGAGASSLFASTVVAGAVGETPRGGVSAEVIAVPEPGTVALLLAGLWSAATYCRFRRPKSVGVR
jgi:fibronectin-binding autotransporter adhesin